MRLLKNAQGFAPEREAKTQLDGRAAAARVAELFDAHGKMVYGLCRVLLRDPHDAEDAAQQTFLSAHRALLAGQEPRDAGAWIATIARNECRARIRARMSTPLALVEADVAGAADVDSVATQRAEARALCEGLAELPQQQRQALVLREFYGLSYDEAATALGVSRAALESLIFRGRQKLQDQIRPARVAQGALALPVTLRDGLAHALPGFASGGAGGGGLLVKIVSAPIAAKIAAAAVVVTTTPAVVAATGGERDPRRAAAPAAIAPAAAVSAFDVELLEARPIVAEESEDAARARRDDDDDRSGGGSDDERDDRDDRSGGDRDDDDRDDDARDDEDDWEEPDEWDADEDEDEGEGGARDGLEDELEDALDDEEDARDDALDQAEDLEKELEDSD